MEGLICPKCHGTMRSYERSGVTVDQCSECRGIFLDRGELERLVDAENAWHGSPAAAPSSPQAHQQPGHQAGYEQSGHQQQGYPQTGHQQPGHQQPAASLGAVVSEVLGQVRSSSSHSSSSHGYGQKRKKKDSFLSDLFG